MADKAGERAGKYESKQRKFKKDTGLIVFTVILLIALWNYSLILDVLGQGVGIVYPFLLGGAIAFVINVPMSFFEEKAVSKSNDEK